MTSDPTEVNRLSGRCWVFGDNISADVIHPPQFFSLDPAVVKKGLFHGLDPSIQPALQAGDIIVAGENFGCGSSRETTIQSLLLNRVGAILAVDFSRIFFRSATNNGLRCLTPRHAADLAQIKQGDSATIDFDAWTVTLAPGTHIPLEPPNDFIQDIWRHGGLLGLLDR